MRTLYKKVGPSLFVMALSACSATTDEQISSEFNERLIVPNPQISELSPGKANIKIDMEGSAKELFEVRSCSLGKFAADKNATHVKIPDRTEVLARAIAGRSVVSLDQNFEYFSGDESSPESSKETKELLESCNSLTANQT